MKNFSAIFSGFLSRSKGVLLTAALCSIGIAVVAIGTTNSPGTDIDIIKLGFIDNDKSVVAADFSRYLESDLGIELVVDGDIDTMNTRLVDKRISGLIEVPAGFEAALLDGNPEPVLLTFMGDYANEAFTKAYLESYMQSIGVVAMMAGGDSARLSQLLEETSADKVEVAATEKDHSALKAQADKNGYRLMISFFMMFSFIMSICISTMIFADRTEGTYRRIKAGRVTSIQYVSSVAAIGGLLMLLINGPSLFLYSLTGNDPGIPLYATAGLLAIYSLFIVAFGLLIGLVMPSHGGIVAVIIAVTTISSMLGGAWFPAETSPRLFQILGYATPQHWFFQSIDAWQSGAGSTVGPALVIVLASVLCFVLAGIQFTTNKSLSRI